MVLGVEGFVLKFTLGIRESAQSASGAIKIRLATVEKCLNQSFLLATTRVCHFSRRLISKSNFFNSTKTVNFRQLYKKFQLNYFARCPIVTFYVHTTFPQPHIVRQILLLPFPFKLNTS